MEADRRSGFLMALDAVGEGCGEPSQRVDSVHFAGLDQRGDDGQVFGSCVVSGEEGVFSVEDDGAFDGVFADFHVVVG